ncbi:hypothetical protein P691DRAFT_400393 [Macrolepiota fuliginosa MF-IS2]|uniref:Uncharacterized protein n=1 Tax=Macrolepiota fuliginosa MF-IS2 TaxID=1400762 RepID=A0A9P5XL51_9AGAR|nr:hypothetical protein P691DRAFT_400393 [Macrolepiota fuliginosa MF-IS2]
MRLPLPRLLAPIDILTVISYQDLLHSVTSLCQHMGVVILVNRRRVQCLFTTPRGHKQAPMPIQLLAFLGLMTSCLSARLMTSGRYHASATHYDPCLLIFMNDDEFSCDTCLTTRFCQDKAMYLEVSRSVLGCLSPGLPVSTLPRSTAQIYDI